MAATIGGCITTHNPAPPGGSLWSYATSSGPGLLVSDIGPERLSNLAAQVFAQWIIDHKTRLRSAGCPSFPTDKVANQLIFDKLIDKVKIDDEILELVIRCFEEAPIRRLILKGSSVSTGSLRSYLLDPRRARAIAHLNLADTANVTHGLENVITLAGTSPTLPNLAVLNLGSHVDLLRFHPQANQQSLTALNPNLKALILHGMNDWHDFFAQVSLQQSDFFWMVLQPIPNLVYLDASFWKFADLGFLQPLTKLTSLILHEVPDLYRCLPQIRYLTSLQHLDISQSDQQRGHYPKPAIQLNSLILALPFLASLDISGTNLASNPDPLPDEWPERLEFLPEGETAEPANRPETDIVGLRNLKRPLKFLGLLNCNRACFIKRIPAVEVTGTATPQQILLALERNYYRPAMLHGLLIETFPFFRNPEEDDFSFRVACLGYLATAMKDYAGNINLQIACSASLFYLMRARDQSPERRNVIPKGLRRRLSIVLVKSLEDHFTDPAMARNTCLNLCLLQLPEDVPQELHMPLAHALLITMAEYPRHSTLIRFACMVLKMLSSPVPLEQKKAIGALGAIGRCVQAIRSRMGQPADETMEILWSVLWSLTDECPENSQRFLDADGMLHFAACYENFASHQAVATAMSGLVGNIAEVRSLHAKLLKDEYIIKFIHMLTIYPPYNDFEQAYNAAGVLVNLLGGISEESSSVEEEWRKVSPSHSFSETSDIIVSSIDRWDLSAPRAISYRTFRPLIRLLSYHRCRVAQIYGAWAMANFTSSREPEKYCEFVEQEGALPMLQLLAAELANSDEENERRLCKLVGIVLRNMDLHRLRKEEWRGMSLERPPSRMS